MASPRLVSAASSTRTEADVRARRAQLEADLIAEGASADTVGRLATDETAAALVRHERQLIAAISGLFGGAR